MQGFIERLTHTQKKINSIKRFLSSTSLLNNLPFRRIVQKYNRDKRLFLLPFHKCTLEELRLNGYSNVLPLFREIFIIIIDLFVCVICMYIDRLVKSGKMLQFNHRDDTELATMTIKCEIHSQINGQRKIVSDAQDRGVLFNFGSRLEFKPSI